MFLRTNNKISDLERKQGLAWAYLEPIALSSLKAHRQEERFEGRSYQFNKAMQMHFIHIYFSLMYVDYKEGFLTYQQLLDKYKFPCIKKYFFCWKIDFDYLLKDVYDIVDFDTTYHTGIEGDYAIECSFVVQKEEDYCKGTDLPKYNVLDFLTSCISCTNWIGQSRIEYSTTLAVDTLPLLIDDCKEYLLIDNGMCTSDNTPYRVDDNGIYNTD